MLQPSESALSLDFSKSLQTEERTTDGPTERPTDQGNESPSPTARNVIETTFISQQSVGGGEPVPAIGAEGAAGRLVPVRPRPAAASRSATAGADSANQTKPHLFDHRQKIEPAGRPAKVKREALKGFSRNEGTNDTDI